MPIKDLEERKRRAAVYSKAHYEKNKAAVIARVARNKKANRTWFSTFKRTLKCTNCGENHPATLDFHHVIHQKDNKKVNELVSDGHARARILQEIEKCVVLCSNCHRIWHHDERENRRKRIAKKKKQAKIHTIPTTKGVKTVATKPKLPLFAGKETKKEEKAEKKVGPKAYAKAEKIEEKGMKKGKK